MQLPHVQNNQAELWQKKSGMQFQVDNDLYALRSYVINGFPSPTAEGRVGIQPHWLFRDDMIVIVSELMKGRRIVVGT